MSIDVSQRMRIAPKQGGEECPKRQPKSPGLARSLLDKICASLVLSLKKIIFSKEFWSRHREGAQDFIRTRLLPFPTLILLFINLLKGSIQDELDGFFQAIDQADIPERRVTSSAFCRARKKLKPEAFIELSRHLVAFFYKHFHPRRWRGMRLLAIDGSTLRVPRVEEIAAHFGTWNSALGEPCPLARTSQLFDVLNRITVDAMIAPKNQGERTLAATHLDHVGAGDLLLLDRGYPCFWLFDLILSTGAHFCARLPISGWNIVQSFLASGKAQQTRWLHPTPQAERRYQETDTSAKPLRVRLVRIDLPGAEEPEILITSLLDNEEFPVDLFGDLYHSRWPVEEEYKRIKCRMHIENFSGKSVRSVYQDFHAKVFTGNLTAALAHPVQQEIRIQYAHRKHAYQLNGALALSRMKNTAPLLFLRSGLIDIVRRLHALFRIMVLPVRPGRKCPRRKHAIKIQGFYPAYKPIR
jgi:hypothetical protein